MASPVGEEPTDPSVEPSSSAVASTKSTTIALDTKLMVSKGHVECQKILKNLFNQKDDATVTVVATISSKNQQQASEEKLSLTRLQLYFLAAASDGNSKEIMHLLSRTIDVEEGKTPSASATSLLETVTIEEDTALHLVAANGSSGDHEKFKHCVTFLHEKHKNLLYKENKKGDTPLHCAARAGRYQLVSCLISLAENDGKMQDLLRMVNHNNETVLHEAVRRGDKKMVRALLRADRELASFPTNGVSPLYLAIQLIDDRAILRKEEKQAEYGGDDILKKNKEKSMVQTLHDESKDGSLSYLGPHGQNALHAAVLHSPELTRKLLRWNMDLTIQRDKNGSTPLHFAAGSQGFYGPYSRSSWSILFNANRDALYQLDNDGLSPIHVAASAGVKKAIILFVEGCPGSASLRDSKGRTFLHVAVENKQVWTVYGCMYPWILNMQDNDGNTALHLAVKAGSLRMFSALFANHQLDLNITNAEGQTPLDIAEYKVPPGLFYSQSSEVLIRLALRLADAHRGASRWDHFQANYQGIHGLKSEYETKELENMKDLAQTRSISSVLIATVAFGSTFALPGGYRADDHPPGGTPTLAGRYAFDAFMMANTLAFMFSTSAVLCLVRGGSSTFNRNSRKIYLALAFRFLEYSVTCFSAAFALGVFVMLSPVARKTAIAICVMTPLIILCNRAEFWLRRLLLVPASYVRKGVLWTSCFYSLNFVGNVFAEFWPFLLIFIWAAYGRTHPISNAEPPAQPPAI